MKKLEVRSPWIVASVAAMAAGCGGGQGGAAATAGQAHTAKLGDALLTYFGQPKPQFSTAAGQVSVFGQAGATFSAVTLEPAPNLEDTYLVFSRGDDDENALYEFSFSSENEPTLLYQHDEVDEYPAISAYGAVAFTPARYSLETVRPDGTGFKQLTMGGLTSYVTPTFSVDGTDRLCFMGGAGPGLYTGPGAGGTPTEIQTPTSVSGYLDYEYYLGEAWNPAGTEIAFPVTRDIGGDYYADLFTAAPTVDAAITDVTPLAFQFTGGLYSPSWSSDGATIVATWEPYGDPTSIMTLIAGTQNYRILTPSGYEDSQPCFSPDGSKIAFYRDNSGGATPGIYTCDAFGENQQMLVPDPTGTLVNGGISWSPFLPKETVIAASGSTFFHQSASGFLVSECDSQFGSVVAFTAKTPADAAILSPSPVGNGAPLQFTLTADSITSIGYINDYFDPGTTLTLSSTPSALVSIDGVTGQVDLVGPSTVAKPAVSKNADGTVSYNAPFRALYDGKGKNMAPNGATEVTLNTNTGKVVSFR